MSQVDAFPETVHAVPAGATPSWFTDLSFFIALERRLLESRAIPREFNLDPYANELAPVSQLIKGRKGGAWILPPPASPGGHALNWGETSVSFVNPPYDAETLEIACEKARREAAIGHVVALLPAWTDRGWWQDHIESDRVTGRCVVEFLRGRLPFGWPENPLHIGADSAKFASCVVRWPRRAA